MTTPIRPPARNGSDLVARANTLLCGVSQDGRFSALFEAHAPALVRELVAEVERLRARDQCNRREIFRHTLRENYLAGSIKDGLHTPEEWLEKSDAYAERRIS